MTGHIQKEFHLWSPLKSFHVTSGVRGSEHITHGTHEKDHVHHPRPRENIDKQKDFYYLRYGGRQQTNLIRSARLLGIMEPYAKCMPLEDVVSSV